LVGAAESVVVAATGDVAALLAFSVSAAFATVKVDVATPVWSTAFGKMYIW